LTAKNLLTFKAIEESKLMSEFQIVLQALNLPDNFIKLLEEVPEELQHYIVEEIIEEIFALNDMKIERSQLEKSIS